MSQQPAGSGPSPPYGPEPVVGSGPVRALALAAAGLGLVIYLLGYVGEVSVTSSFGGPLAVAGGLLAGTAVLPRVGRVLAPALMLAGTGALLLLQMCIGLGAPLVVIVATVVAFLQVVLLLGALLLNSGVLATGAGRSPPYRASYPGYRAGAGFGPPGLPPGAGEAAGGVGSSYFGPPAAAIGPVDDAGLFTDPDRPGSGSAGSHGARHRSPEPGSPAAEEPGQL